MSSGRRLIFLGLMVAALGCRSQSAKEIVETRLRRALPQHASRAEVEQYLQRERIEKFQKEGSILNGRFRNVKNDLVCTVDVSVDFIFDQNRKLIDHRSEEMRICL